MSKLIINHQDEKLILSLTVAEKVISVHKNIEIPFSSIARIKTVEHLKTLQYTNWLRQIKAGLFVPNVIARGTFFNNKEKKYLSFREGQPGIEIELVNSKLNSIILHVEDPIRAQVLIDNAIYESDKTLDNDIINFE